MFKRVFRMSVIFVLCAMVFLACSSNTKGEKSTSSLVDENVIEDSKVQTNVIQEDKLQKMGMEELDNLLSEQPLSVVGTEYVKQMYPDMLRAIISNNGAGDIKDASIAFVAWDSNNLPVKIRSNVDFTNGSYVREVKYNDINLVSGSTYGEGRGFAIDSSNDISIIKAIAISFETFDGEKWENPHYDKFKSMYEGKNIQRI